MAKSALELARFAYEPKIPHTLKGFVKLIEGEITQASKDEDSIRYYFPNSYKQPLIEIQTAENKCSYPEMNAAVILSGGQAPGGHNVIAGLYDGLKLLNPDNRLFGFLMGPNGLLKGEYRELTAAIIDDFRNTGGFDMIGSGRTKLETPEQFEQVRETLEGLNIKALVIIGGDDSNTNACDMAEYFLATGADIKVVGCPKTIDGDLKNEYIECSFGFDTASKVYSELIGNIQRDCNSSRKYWHFIKLMGRTASHITLECGLQTHPNVCIISEEIEAENYYLDDVVSYIADIVARRAELGMDFGTVLIPEGLIEFLPAMKRLIAELNEFLAKYEEEFDLIKKSAQLAYITKKLSRENAALFCSLPNEVARELLQDRDPHGNVQVSRIPTEQLLADMVAEKLKTWTEQGKYKGKFSTLTHFFGYEGRCSMPSNFDADYCYSLGRTAAILLGEGKTGYMATVSNTTAPASEWKAGGVPLTAMMNMERRSGKMRPVIRKAMIDLEARPYQILRERRREWALSNGNVYPGPIQFYGPTEICDAPTITLLIEQRKQNP